MHPCGISSTVGSWCWELAQKGLSPRCRALNGSLYQATPVAKNTALLRRSIERCQQSGFLEHGEGSAGTLMSRGRDEALWSWLPILQVSWWAENSWSYDTLQIFPSVLPVHVKWRCHGGVPGSTSSETCHQCRFIHFIKELIPFTSYGWFPSLMKASGISDRYRYLHLHL